MHAITFVNLHYLRLCRCRLDSLGEVDNLLLVDTEVYLAFLFDACWFYTLYISYSFKPH